MLTKTDVEIQEDVLRALESDARVDTKDVTVKAVDGIVTLGGIVKSYPEFLAAQQASHRVAGVLDVANDLEVKLPGGVSLTDADIAEMVRLALGWDAVVPDERIQTTVSHGWVTLEGNVDFPHQREAAERVVQNLTGVRGVDNRIVVQAPEVAAETVRASIEDALRRAEQAADRIEVRVAGGTVTLSGAVRSWAEKEAVLGAARHTPGVRAVDDQIRISPAV